MTTLVIPAPIARAVQDDLLRRGVERCAVLFVSHAARADRLLVRRWHPVPEVAYSRSGSVEAELRPEFVAEVVAEARKLGNGLVFVHSHPGSTAPRFSAVDDQGEQRLAEFLLRRLGPSLKNAAMVISEGGLAARSLGSADQMSVRFVGPTIRTDDEVTFGRVDEAFDRQVRAFGPDGQRALQRLRIGIVGLGGTGSVVAQQLAHLGVTNFLLCDPDLVDTSNLNRLAGARRADVGSPKTAVARRQIAEVAPSSAVVEERRSVILDAVAQELTALDVIFCCTDSHGSRAVLNQLAYQYLVPTIDVGVVIASREQVVTRIAGRTQMLAPGLGCLTCAALLDADSVRRELMREADTHRDPYFTGAGAPQPAVMSLNSTMSSMAVTMLLAAVTQMPSAARLVLYDATSGVSRGASVPIDPTCVVCSVNGALATGDSWPLPTRKS